MKSDKNIVRDVLRAQGLWDVEPTEEAVKVIRDFGYAKWCEGDDYGRQAEQFAQQYEQL